MLKSGLYKKQKKLKILLSKIKLYIKYSKKLAFILIRRTFKRGLHLALLGFSAKYWVITNHKFDDKIWSTTSFLYLFDILFNLFLDSEHSRLFVHDGGFFQFKRGFV